MPKIHFKNDAYRRARGGHSRLLQIYCRTCHSYICTYQKDGPGVLKRMYIDRITEPQVSIRGKKFSCPHAHLLGVKIIYGPENRPAFRLFVDGVVKKAIK